MHDRTSVKPVCNQLNHQCHRGRYQWLASPEFFLKTVSVNLGAQRHTSLILEGAADFLFEFRLRASLVSR